MRKAVLLSTDTLHHRYLINRLKKEGLVFDAIIFETNSVKAPFVTGPFFEKEENEFEKNNFFVDIDSDISRENIIEVENINNEESLNELRKLNPEIGVVFGTRMLKKHIINSFKDGLFNIHRGIAQEYRGLDSDLWAIYHSDIKNIGVTLHKVDQKLDTGDIALQEKLKLTKGTEIFHLRFLTSVLATDMVIQALKDYYSKNKIKVYPQNKFGRYYSFMPLCIKETLVKKFHKKLNE